MSLQVVDVFSSIRGGDSSPISKLPDECTAHIFSFVTSPRDRCSCAAVSRHWLLLQAVSVSSPSKSATPPAPGPPPPPPPPASSSTPDQQGRLGVDETKGSRLLTFGSANDARLAAMAVGSSALKRAVTHLTVRTHFVDPPPGSSLLRLTDRGLGVVSRAFPELRYLTLLGCDAVSDGGLAAVAAGCPVLEGLHLFNAARVSEDGLVAVAANCRRLSFLTLHMCRRVGDAALHAFARFSSNLEHFSLDDCPLMGHGPGLGAVLSSAPRLAKVTIAFMEVRDQALGAVADRGGDSSALSLCMEEVSGFTRLGFHRLVQAAKLRRLSVRRCTGIDDVSAALSDVVVVDAGGAGNVLRAGLATAAGAMLINSTGTGVGLRSVAVRNCEGFTDRGLAVLSESARQLAFLRLEKCHRVTTRGVVNAVGCCSGTLKLLSLVRCNGIGGGTTAEEEEEEEEEGAGDRVLLQGGRRWRPRAAATAARLQILVIKHCRGVGDEFLSLLGMAAGKATRVEVVGMRGVTDRGFVSLLAHMEHAGGVREVDLSGCRRITDWSVVALAGAAGEALNRITLRGCSRLTDRSLRAIGQLCPRLDELDLSGCAGVGDGGVAALLGRGVGGAAWEVLQAAREGTAPRRSLLDTLSLEGCGGVTDRCLRVLADLAAHGSLEWVNLKGTAVSRGGIEALRSAFPRCRFLDQ